VFVDKLLEELSEGISRAVRALMEAEVWTPLVAPTIPKYRRHHRPIDSPSRSMHLTLELPSGKTALEE
jgi:hypothetical protein